MKNTTASVSDVETQMEWRLAAASCTETEGNPFKLDDSVLERTKTAAPPLHETAIWKKGIPDDVWEYHGRRLIHDCFVRYDNAEQPREKSNEVDQVNELVNDFEVYGYREDAQPPICVPDTKNNDPSQVKDFLDTIVRLPETTYQSNRTYTSMMYILLIVLIGKELQEM